MDHDVRTWLMREGRLLGDGVAIVEGLGKRLVSAGVPLTRLRVAQRFANPLITAWGVIWRSDGTPTQDYVITHEMMQTETWIGSPFQAVTLTRTSMRADLNNLAPDAHVSLHEQAASGATDYYAMPLEFGDGSVQGMSLVTDSAAGFTAADIELFEDLRDPLAAAMEPVAMRRSERSLLRTYLGQGPAQAVIDGAVHRGDVTSLDAIILFADLRDFTRKSAIWSPERLLDALDQYFEIVVQAVAGQGGDVLKFLGDGLLAVFPVKSVADAPERSLAALTACIGARQALQALNERRVEAGQDALDFGTALHRGRVVYGNIGAPDRLDFTVIGDTVNTASRIEGLGKDLSEPVLISDTVAMHLKDHVQAIGHHRLRGVPEPVLLFRPVRQTTEK